VQIYEKKTRATFRIARHERGFPLRAGLASVELALNVRVVDLSPVIQRRSRFRTRSRTLRALKKPTCGLFSISRHSSTILLNLFGSRLFFSQEAPSYDISEQLKKVCLVEDLILGKTQRVERAAIKLAIFLILQQK